MTNCEYSNLCFFYNKKIDDMPKTYEYIKSKFCDGNFCECERYKLSKSLGIEKVPDDMLPVCFKSMKCFYGM